jgi:HAD superfamily hydrolase (TIGR01549 family)
LKRSRGHDAIRVVSFDMDGTLIDAEFTEWVWKHGIPMLYATREGLSFEAARSLVEREYEKVGDGAIAWYDIKYWLDFFQLRENWRDLLGRYVDKISVYPDVIPLLQRLRKRFSLVLISNAAREFIEVELRTTGLEVYFEHIFSATSDFGRVKKTTGVYEQVCQILGVPPEWIVHVGDHYEFDYLVPQSLGIQAYFLDRSGQRPGDAVIMDLGKLEEKIQDGEKIASGVSRAQLLPGERTGGISLPGKRGQKMGG